MVELSALLGELEQDDIEWMLEAGSQVHLAPGDRLIRQGGRPDGLFLILDGFLEVRLDGVEGSQATIRPGELVGEISFLDLRPASANVSAAGDATVLRVGRSELEARMEDRPRFGARLYHALGMLLAERFRSDRPSHKKPFQVEKPEFREMAGALAHTFTHFADRPAYETDEGWITYARSGQRVKSLAVSLKELRGDHPVVATLLPNCHQVLEMYYASALSGSVLFPANYRLAPTELVGIFQTSGAGVLLTSSEFEDKLSQLDWDQVPIHTIIWLDKICRIQDVRHLLWSTVLSEQPSGDLPEPPTPRSHLQGFGTSGTTGEPKMILHTHASVLSHSYSTMQALHLHSGDQHCWAHFGPMFHVGDVAFVWISTILGARHVFLANPLDFKKAANLMSESEVTICKIVPSMLKLMVHSGAAAGLQFPKLRWILTGGAAPDHTLVRQTSELFGCDFIQGYGMTEATCHVAFKNETQSPPNKGLAVLPGLELRIVDEEHNPVENGAIGEVAIRGANVFSAQIAEGKVVPPREGAFTRDGFYLSGDLGKLDKDGLLHISGRSKDMINVGGENVFAAEVEAIVYRIKGVKQCAAFSMPHPDLGEVVELAVVRSEAGLDQHQISNWCRQLLASYKCPRRVHFLDSLPLTPTGKVRKMILQEQVLALGPAPLDEPSTKHDTPVESVLQNSLEAVGLVEFPRERSLFEGGLDSLGALDLMDRLQAGFRRPLPASLLYEYPTVQALEKYFESWKEAPPVSQPQSDTSEEPAEPPEKPLQGRPMLGLLRLLFQMFGLLLRPAILAGGVVPLLVLMDVLSARFTRWELFLMAPVGLAGALISTMLLAVLFKWLLVGRIRPGRYALWSSTYHRWMMVNNLFRCMEFPLGVLRGTALLNAFYRMCGARIGPGVRLESADLQDLDLIEIGSGTVVGRDVNLQPAVLRDGSLVLEPVAVGSDCVLGPQASVLGGTTIPDGQLVQALDTTPCGAAEKPLRGPGFLVRTVGLVVVGYAASAALAAGILVLEWFNQGLPSLYLLFSGTPANVSLKFFAGLALAIHFVMPVTYYALVVVLKRVFRVGPWLYARLIDVPFFPAFLRMFVMSHLMKWAYQGLGARVGARPFLAAPYVEDPGALEVGDRAMLAGNVSVYGPVALEPSSVVANSCVLQDGARLGSSSLLGDLSRLSKDDPTISGVIAVGRPPRVVGASDFQPDELSTSEYGLLQAWLVCLQWTLVVGCQIPGFLVFGFLIRQLATTPFWLMSLLPVLLLIPRGLKVLLFPAAKWLLLQRVREGEHPAYGPMWVRWLAMEAMVMDLEQTLLLLRGTVFLPVLYRALGARVGVDTCLFSSSLGTEYDLKSIGDGALLNHRSLVFGHSIERHTLIFKSCVVKEGAELGCMSIAEAGAVVASAVRVAPHTPVHARRERTETLVNIADYEKAARRKLPEPIFGYFAGGSGDGRALARNQSAFSEIRYAPRVLVDVTRVSISCRLLERRLSSPILVAPTAMNRLVHNDGEIGVATAVRQLGMGMILSTLSNTPLEKVGELFQGDSGLALFQLYAMKDRELTEALMHRAAEGGFSGIVLTVDAPVSGRRERDIRSRFQVADKVALPHIESLAWDSNSRLLAFERAKDASLDWEHLKRLVDLSPLPVWLKGVMRPEDALKALDHGVSGLILSNHGGRQLDCSPSALDVLPQVRRALDQAGQSAPLLIDGGVRRGEHVFAALALGATAVLVGRPVVWGLAEGGRGGVSRVLAMLNEELMTAMRLAGCTNLSEIESEGIVLKN